MVKVNKILKYIPVHYLKSLLKVFFLITVFPAMLHAEELFNLWNDDVLLIGFDQDEIIKNQTPVSIQCKNKKCEITSDGVSGNALTVKEGGYFILETGGFFNPQEGTLAFCVRPHWGNNSNKSHTFVSGNWRNSPNSYFVISNGWWEHSGGSEFTYFIFNNSYSTKTQIKIDYNKKEWINLVCTWRKGKNGFIRLYYNGHKIVEGYNFEWDDNQSIDRLFFGSDSFNPLEKNRWADCDFDEIYLSRKALNDSEVYQLFSVHGYQGLKILKKLNQPIRALFDESTEWMTEKGANEAIKKVVDAGFNTYVPCIWHGQGTRYFSKKEIQETGIVKIGVDPLERLISIAHQNNIKIHPWFTITLRQRDFLKKYYGQGEPNNSFNIHNSNFREFIVKLVLDVVDRYEIDGVVLDYIRTMGICRSNYCQKNYKEMTGRDLLNDLQQNSKNGGLDPNVQRWQDAAVENIVEEIYKGVKKKKSQIILSVCGHPRPNDETPSIEGRQEIIWANKGIIDLIFSMDYRYTPDFQMFAKVKKELKNPEKLILLIGNYDKINNNIVSRDSDRIRQLLDTIYTRYSKSFGVYWYSSLNQQQIKIIKEMVDKN